MQAVRIRTCGGPEVMKVEEVGEPRPGAGEVLVRIAAAGVNPVDTYLRSGTQGYAPSLPCTPGFDGAGTVELCSEGSGRFPPGQRVYCGGSISGTYAEYALCREEQLHPLPENISFSRGAGIGIPYATAYRALFLRAAARAGETVLIHGASGSVGAAALQMASAAGLKCIGSSSTPEGRSRVLALGAFAAVDHSDPRHCEEVLDLTGGRGADIILEMRADLNLGGDLPLAAPFGRIVIIGSRGEVRITPRDLMRSNAAVLGLSGAQPGEEQLYPYLEAGLNSGTLVPEEPIELPLTQAPRAHRMVIEGPARGKIVLLPQL
jgi:NADPH:quinone reductase